MQETGPFTLHWTNGNTNKNLIICEDLLLEAKKILSTKINIVNYYFPNNFQGFNFTNSGKIRN